MKYVTKKNIKEFDRLLSKSESINGYDRVIGRLELQIFLKTFTKEQQDYMAEKIGATRT